MIAAKEPNERRRMAVAVFEPWLDTLDGPSELGILKAVVDLGYRTTVLLPAWTDRTINSDCFSAIGVENRIQPCGLVSLCLRALETLLREKPSTVLFDYVMLPVFLVYKTIRECKGIFLITSRPVSVAGLRGWLHYMHFRISLILARGFVANYTAISPFEAQAFSRLANVPGDTVLLRPSPLGEGFEKSDWLVDEDCQRMALGHGTLVGKKILLYHGVFHEGRGIIQLLELFARSFKNDSGTILLLVGDGPLRDPIADFIKSKRMSNILLWDPLPYSRMPETIACCDVGLVLFPDHPWWRYQCPTKLIELLAMGKPVIASDLPGIRWVGGDSSLVVYLKRWEVGEFREAVMKALAAKELGTPTRVQIRRDMINRFSARSIAMRLSEVLS